MMSVISVDLTRKWRATWDTIRLHDDPNQHHADTHRKSSDNHWDSSSPFVHIEHIRQCEDIQNDSLKTIG